MDVRCRAAGGSEWKLSLLTGWRRWKRPFEERAHTWTHLCAGGQDPRGGGWGECGKWPCASGWSWDTASPHSWTPAFVPHSLQLPPQALVHQDSNLPPRPPRVPCPEATDAPRSLLPGSPYVCLPCRLWQSGFSPEHNQYLRCRLSPK